ncbi:RNA-binding protein 44 [Anarrhichthys ocellatus]|uniref:RNA-binding protein 44 n=1 Tax=Anarrhichthys ocellatus TaxID=433405 RepID=UPI0012EDC1F5|nr:RNA-binding protein 44 [Anarrhichthys ocellatus]
MAVFQSAWPPYSYVASEYANVGVPLHHLMPCFYNMVVEKPGPKAIRSFLLERSVFDLVDYHKFLSLTDPKLLGWYLCLSAEDRTIIQDEGGFQQFLLRHPALELTRHHVYVKCHVSSVRPAQPAVMSNRPTHVSQSTLSGATKCGSDLERLPNTVRETLNLLGCSNSGDVSQKHPAAFNSFPTLEPHQQNVCSMGASSHLNEQRPSWQTSSKDSAALTSFSLDVDLERHRQGGQPELRSQGQSPISTYAEVSLLQSEWPTIEKGLSPEYYSFDSVQMDGTEYSDRSVLQPVKLEATGSPLDPVEENSPEEGLHDHMACGNEYTEGEDEASLSFGDQSDNFHSIMESDKSILACLISDDIKAQNSGVHSGPVHTDGAANSETSKSDQSVAAEHCCSLMPRVATRDITVGTELPPCTSAVTQTERPETADKHVITEVHMVDLDYLAEEFIKLKKVREKLRGQKEEMKSCGGKLRKDCDCVQRAQRAELRLLALQHSMCRQYCWRLYYTSSEGVTPKNPSANIASVLQQLESEYNLMRDEILAGVPLEQLRPLSVDSEKVTTHATFIPAKTISEVLGNVPSRSSQEPQKHKTSGEENGCPADQSTNGSQLSQRKMENSKARRAVAVVPQDGDATHNAHKPEEKKTTEERQELNTCEAWYDAEENLQHAGPAAAAKTGQEPTVKDETNESASEEVKSSVLCVSNLPGNVTESDVMLCFEKYHASEVSISALKNDVRVAIVMVSGPQSAEAAVRELRGCCMQGHALHVEHINRASGGSQRPASASIRGLESSGDSTGPQSSKTERKLISQPLLSSSMKNRKVVCISPTAQGTCVPQHYGTMGSFDTLMAELSQRHPDVGRQRIVDALMELKAKHRGVLSGLPLRTIREMTSELLTRPAARDTTL